MNGDSCDMNRTGPPDDNGTNCESGVPVMTLVGTGESGENGASCNRGEARYNDEAAEQTTINDGHSDGGTKMKQDSTPYECLEKTQDSTPYERLDEDKIEEAGSGILTERSGTGTEVN